MLVADISDQLGNQMFAYASVKTIAEKKGYSFGFVRARNNRINDSDKRYGNEVHTIFPNTAKEFLTKLPPDILHTFVEKVAPDAGICYLEQAEEVQDQTYMKGHFISYRYFSDNMEHVRRWFSFSEDIDALCRRKMELLRNKYPDKELVAIHFRAGEDYLRQGFLLNPSYWLQAAEYMIQKYGKDHIVFVPFYDSRKGSGKIVDRFMKKYPCEVIRGSLVEDMCCMTLFQNLIVCNSSFSIMAGILNDQPDKLVLRPSVYPAENRLQPADCFPDDWGVIPAKQSIVSRCNYRWMVCKGKLLTLFRRKTNA